MLSRHEPSVSSIDDLFEKRRSHRNMLDGFPNFEIDSGVVTHIRHCVTLETAESFPNAPDDIHSAVVLVSRRIDTAVVATVTESLNFKIGSCVIPVFALVSGGRGRSLFTFKCLFESCPAFLDIRTLDLGEQIKGMAMGISHSHDFSVFPSHVPRNIIPDSVKAEVELMVTENHLCS